MLLSAVIVFIGPLFPFTRLNFLGGEQPIYEIVGASVTISIYSSKKELIGKVFESKLMLNSKKMERNSEKWGFIEKSEIYPDISPQAIRVVKMSKYSQIYHDIAQTSMSKEGFDLSNMLKNGHMEVDIEFTSQKGEFKSRVIVDILDTHVDEIESVLSSSCTSAKLSKEMFLKEVPIVYILSTPPNMTLLQEQSLMRYTRQKWSIGVECSSCKAPTFI